MGLLLLIVSCPLGWTGQQVSDLLDWPPVMERAFGDPKVVVKQRPLDGQWVTNLPLLNRIRVAQGQGQPHSVKALLAQYYLERSWHKFLSEDAKDVYERRMRMQELIPMSRPQFIASGHRLLAGRSSGDPVVDAWWRVRMGCRLQPSQDYSIGFTTLILGEEGKLTFGHFSMGLRRRGGDADGDTAFDFRAPWLVDRRPRSTEAFNIHDRLQISVWTDNLYDWTYTQHEMRNCHVRVRTVPTFCEQVTLLKAFCADSQSEPTAFRVFKKNCASLGTRFADRLLPFDRAIPGKASLIDFPFPKNDLTVEAFGGALDEVYIENRTTRPTNKTAIHQARPSREGSISFQKMRELD